MTAEENKTVVRALWEGLFNRGDVALAHDLIAPDFVNHAIPGAAPGPEALAQAARLYRAAFPDGLFAIEEMLADGDRVAMRNTFTGTHRSVFMGVSPTGRRVTQEQIHIVRVVGGKVAEHRAVRDDLTLLRQLRAIPAQE